MISIVNGIDIEAWVADAILSGYGEAFAEAVVKAYEARKAGHMLYEPLDMKSLGHECPQPTICPAAKDGWCHAE